MTDPQQVAQTVLGHIMLNPEEHDQSDYGTKDGCQTAMCVAGWSVQLFKPEVISWVGEGKYKFMKHAVTKDVQGIHDEAQELLGLNDEDAWHLFMSNNEKAIKNLMRLARGKKIKVEE